MVRAMATSSDLQQIARMVDLNRQRLEEVQSQLTRVDSVLFEHEETIAALDSLSEGSKGHIPLGAGVMVPISQDITTIVDLGSGIFGERLPKDASEIVKARHADLSEIKKQFETEIITITNRIEELSQSFDKLSSELTKSSTEVTNDEPQEEQSKPKPRRRRRIGEELTLDD
jgi:prefoldin alpha subunit